MAVPHGIPTRACLGTVLVGGIGLGESLKMRLNQIALSGLGSFSVGDPGLRSLRSLHPGLFESGCPFRACGDAVRTVSVCESFFGSLNQTLSDNVPEGDQHE
jgi:hypothetical protein